MTEKRAFELLMDKFAQEVRIEELLRNLPDYKEFLKLCSFFNFRKYDKKKKEYSGQFVNAFFEISAFLFFENKSKINQKFISEIFGKTYAEFCGERKLSNPQAIRRLKEASIYSKELINDEE